MSLKEQCPILHFGDLGDERGKLVVIEGGQAIPFEIKEYFIFMIRMIRLSVDSMQTGNRSLFWSMWQAKARYVSQMARKKWL